MSGSPPEDHSKRDAAPGKKRTIAQVTNSDLDAGDSSDPSSLDASSRGKEYAGGSYGQDSLARKRPMLEDPTSSLGGPVTAGVVGLSYANKTRSDEVEEHREASTDVGTETEDVSSARTDDGGSSSHQGVEVSSFGTAMPFATGGPQQPGLGSGQSLPLIGNPLAQHQMPLFINPFGGLSAPTALPFSFVTPQMMAGIFANPAMSFAGVAPTGIPPELLASYLLSGSALGRMLPNPAMMHSFPSTMVRPAVSFNPSAGDLSNATGTSQQAPPSADHGSAAGNRRGPQLPMLFTPVDEDVLSDYQIMLRRQVEFFEATQEDVDTTTPGRHRDIVLGQVGIRCRHCVHLPLHMRTKGSVYYPFKLKGLYQAAQNMSSSHLCKSCESIHPAIRAQLLAYNEGKSSSGYGGKQYWADAAKAQGFVETEERGLQFSQDDPS